MTGALAFDGAVDAIGAEILVVEDTPASLKLLSDLLTGEGYRVRQAPDGEVALWSANAKPPELILLDVCLPGIDGFAVCRQLKATPALCEVPVIFLSAYSDALDKLEGFAAGGVDYILKPFHFEEVRARVATHIKIARLQARLAFQNDHLQQLVETKAAALAATEQALRAERHLRDLAESESRQRLAELAHMNRNASATVYCAALVHELNQPLAAILSNAEAAELFLKMDPPALGEVAEILSDIGRDDLRASELIARMRELLRKSELAQAPLMPGALVHNVAALLAGEARMRHATLTVEVDQAMPAVLADRVQLQQVLINLVLNGLDALDGAATSRRQVLLRAGVDAAGWASIDVIDSGCGFGGNASQVFDSFFTTKSDGMGLGLSICAAIVSAHGGRIWARDNPDGGATVGFCLPPIAPS